MTSFIAWAGIDSRAVSSVYFASDSRLSVPLLYNPATGKIEKRWYWDYGRKLFASNISPDIFAYVGDVLFPSQVLGQMVDLIDVGVLFEPYEHPDRKLEKIIGYFREASGIPLWMGLNMLYCSRLDHNGRSSLKSTFEILQD